MTTAQNMLKKKIKAWCPLVPSCQDNLLNRNSENVINLIFFVIIPRNNVTKIADETYMIILDIVAYLVLFSGL